MSYFDDTCLGPELVKVRGQLVFVPPFDLDPFPIMPANPRRHSVLFGFLQAVFPITYTIFAGGKVISSNRFPPRGNNCTLELKRSELGELITEPISCHISTTLGIFSAELSGSWCHSDCGCDEVSYSSRTVQVIAPSGSSAQIWGNNSQRRTIILSSDTTLSLGFDNKQFTAFGVGGFFVTTGAFTLTMTYKDYGPLVTGDLWVSGSAGGIQVTATEIFEVPRSR